MSVPMENLGNLTRYIKRGVTPKYVNEDGFCVLNQKCVREGAVNFEASRLTSRNKRFNEEKALQDGDVLVNSTGTGTLGRTALFSGVSQSDTVLVDSHITIVRPNQKLVNPRYLAYALRLKEPNIVNMARGSTNQVELSATDLSQLELPLFTKDRQDRIASILQKYDELISNNKRRIELLENSARLLYKEWFVRFLFPGHEHVKTIDGVPEGWIKKPLSDLSSLLARGVAPKYDDDGIYTIINQKCIRNRLLSMELIRHQSKDFKKEKLVQSGDVLINSTGTGTLGRVAQCWIDIENCTVDTHVTIVRPKNEVCSYWFGYHLLELEPIFEGMGEGATNQKELKRGLVGALTILTPPYLLQSEFHDIVESNCKQIINLIGQNTMLVKARDILLPKLMSGELAV
jgi:type I restriction enzyme S subunit